MTRLKRIVEGGLEAGYIYETDLSKPVTVVIPSDKEGEEDKELTVYILNKYTLDNIDGIHKETAERNIYVPIEVLMYRFTIADSEVEQALDSLNKAHKDCAEIVARLNAEKAELTKENEELRRKVTELEVKIAIESKPKWNK